MSAMTSIHFDVQSKFNNVNLNASINFNQNFQRAVEGDVTAQRYIADCYYYGEGSCQDLQQAYRWYTLAAENGDSIAAQFLEICMQVINFDQSHTSIHNWFHA